MERTETPAQRRKPPVNRNPVPVATAPAPYSAEAQRRRSLAGRTQSRRTQKMQNAYTMAEYADQRAWNSCTAS